MEQVTNMPAWAWVPVIAFFAFIAYRVYRAKTKPKSTGTGGGGKPRDDIHLR